MPSFARQRSASAYPKGSGSGAYFRNLSARRPRATRCPTLWLDWNLWGRRPPISRKCSPRLMPAADEGFHRFERPHVCRGTRASQSRTLAAAYRCASLGRLDLARQVYDLFVEVCPVVLAVTLADTDRAADLVCGNVRTSARDAIHAAVMLNNDTEWIATFDSGFDGIPGIRRMKLP